MYVDVPFYWALKTKQNNIHYFLVYHPIVGFSTITICGSIASEYSPILAVELGMHPAVHEQWWVWLGKFHINPPVDPGQDETLKQTLNRVVLHLVVPLEVFQHGEFQGNSILRKAWFEQIQFPATTLWIVQTNSPKRPGMENRTGYSDYQLCWWHTNPIPAS